MSVALFVATLGNGLVTGEVLAAKEGPACISFENRNNPAKDVGLLNGEYPYAEQCQSKSKDFDRICGYGVTTEEEAEISREFISNCAKQNQ